MTRSTENQRLATACRHRFDPLRLVSACVCGEVFQSSNVVHFNVIGCPTVLAGVGQEAFFEFCASSIDARWLVIEDCSAVPLQGNASPLGDQWLLAFSHSHNLESLIGSPLHGDRRFVALVALVHREPEFGCQGLDERLLHHPLERIQAAQIVRESLIVHETPIFGLIVGHDGEITFRHQFWPVSGFAFALIALAFLLSDAGRDAKSDASIDTPLGMRTLGGVVEHLNCIAEEASALTPGMGNECLCVGEFQLEMIA